MVYNRKRTLSNKLAFERLVLGGWRLDHLQVCVHLPQISAELNLFRLCQAIEDEVGLTFLSDFADAFHRLNRIRHQHAIILDRIVATFLELERGITRELL